MDNKDFFDGESFDLSDEKKSDDKQITQSEYFEDKTEEKEEDEFESFDKDGFTDNRENTGYLFNEPKYDDVLNNGQPKSRAWSVAAMILGIGSIVTCCVGFIAIVAAVLAIVFAIISRKNLGYFDGMSIAGLILGIFGFVFGISSLIALGTVFEEIIDELENMPYDEIPDPNNGF